MYFLVFNDKKGIVKLINAPSKYDALKSAGCSYIYWLGKDPYGVFSASSNERFFARLVAKDTVSVHPQRGGIVLFTNGEARVSNHLYFDTEGNYTHQTTKKF